MDLENIIRNRRSIRRYLSDDIDAETIGRLIECGRFFSQRKIGSLGKSWCLREKLKINSRISC